MGAPPRHLLLSKPLCVRVRARNAAEESRGAVDGRRDGRRTDDPRGDGVTASTYKTPAYTVSIDSFGRRSSKSLGSICTGRELFPNVFGV